MAARTTAVVSLAICFIFGAGCSWRRAVANDGSRGGCADNGSCGAVLELSNPFFGALAGARFFFGFRPRLLGIRVTRLAQTVSRSHHETSCAPLEAYSERQRLQASKLRLQLGAGVPALDEIARLSTRDRILSNLALFHASVWSGVR